MYNILIWVYVKVEVSTDGGLVGHYWLVKKHAFMYLPPLGMELDYRHLTRETVILDRLLQSPPSNPEDPASVTYMAYQDSWLSIGVGDLALWEHAGWAKMDMSDEDVKNEGKSKE